MYSLSCLPSPLFGLDVGGFLSESRKSPSISAGTAPSRADGVDGVDATTTTAAAASCCFAMAACTSLAGGAWGPAFATIRAFRQSALLPCAMGIPSGGRAVSAGGALGVSTKASNSGSEVVPVPCPCCCCVLLSRWQKRQATAVSSTTIITTAATIAMIIIASLLLLLQLPSRYE
eukprot:COSAG06_NODE_10338_length_1698_cov_5.639775_4_plen_175_part_00